MANPRDGGSTDVESIWRELRNGIQDVYGHREMSSARFMDLYTHVYNYCTKNPGAGDNSRRNARVRKQAVGEISGASTSHYAGHDLYVRIREFLKNYLIELTQKGVERRGEDLLNFYLYEWERFTFSSRVMNGFCSYLNRHWIKRETDEGRFNVYQIYQLALDMWKEHFFEPLHLQLIATALQQIERARTGKEITPASIKGLVSSLVALGPDGSAEDRPQNQNRNDDLGIYQRRFEDDFIKESEAFYKKESEAYFASENSVPEYMKKVEQRLKEEKLRVDLYLHTSTMERLLRSCDTVLIENQMAVMMEEFPKLLRGDKDEDMGRMYDLVARLTDAFGTMRDLLQTHIAQEGRNAILHQKDLCNNDPKEYIKTVLEVHKRYFNLVNVEFKADAGFGASLDRACGVFINNNELTTDQNPHKSAEMLARYCDVLLKKGTRNYTEQELEDLLNEAMVIFKFLEDKDVFQSFYRRLYANRLTSYISVSDDAETSMVAKLKQACGFEYTTKLQRMSQDMNVSRGMIVEFRTWLTKQEIAEPMKVDFNIIVLSSGAWPYSSDSNDSFLLPPVLEPCVNIYTQYYGEIHTGRKLSWLYSRSKGDVVTNCYSQRYTLVMHTYGMGVILMYNTNDSYKLFELVHETQLREDVVSQIVQLFMKANLLKSDDDCDKLTLNSVIYLVKDFKNKRLKVNLMGQLRIDVKMEEEKIQKGIESGREYECQAAIVRVMKARRVLTHQQLISEVIELLRTRFRPNVQLVKKCIDILIEREYLARKEGEHNTYVYQT